MHIYMKFALKIGSIFCKVVVGYPPFIQTCFIPGDSISDSFEKLFQGGREESLYT